MFTFNFNVPTSSLLGQKIVFIQHIMAVSIVDAILTLLDDNVNLKYNLKLYDFNF